jgi:hypothetical protein
MERRPLSIARDPSIAEWGILAATTISVLATAFTFLRHRGLLPDVGPTVLHDTDKVWMVLIYLATAASVVALLVIRRRGSVWSSRVPRIGLLVLDGAAAAFALVLAARKDTGSVDVVVHSTDFWIGFGPLAIAAGLLAAIAAVAISIAGRHATLLLVVSSVLTTAVLMPLVIQFPDTYPAGYNNAFTFEELLAPANGRFPGFDYINQYETLLGWPIALAAAVAPAAYAASPSTAAVVWVVILQVLSLAIASLTVARVAPARLRWLVPITVVPMALLTGTVGLTYYAILPIRYILPIVLFALLVQAARSASLGQTRWLLVLGVVAGVVVVNNLDFGVPALFAGGVAIVAVAATVRLALRNGLLYVGGAVVFALLWLLVGALSGRTYHPDYTFYFVRSFGIDNFNNVDMPGFGIHIAYVFVAVAGVIIGVLGARAVSADRRPLYVAIAFQASWLLLSFVYYSGRSLAQTLVIGYAMPLGVLLVLLAIAAFPYLAQMRRTPPRRWHRSHVVISGFGLLALGTTLAAWLFIPSIQAQLDRLSSPPQAGRQVVDYLRPDPRPALAAVPGAADLIGLLSTSGSTWSARLGVRNVSLFLNPEYLSAAAAQQLQCEYLDELPGDVVLTTRQIAEQLGESATCRASFDLDELTTLIRTRHDDQPVAEWVLVSRLAADG